MKIFGVQIDEITKAQALERLGSDQIIFTPNPEILLEARKNPEFRKALSKGDMMLADGHGLLFVSTLRRFQSKSIRALLYLPLLFLFLAYKPPFKRVFPEVIHGSNFMGDLIAWSEKQGFSVFFLGAKPGVAKKTADFFLGKYPSLIVAGYSSSNPSREAFQEVKNSGAQVVLVAYGAPKQEIWIAKYAQELPACKAIAGIGGSFDFYAGEVKRAPLWMRRLGLEWVWRLILQPRARFIRIFNAFIRFPLLALFVED